MRTETVHRSLALGHFLLAVTACLVLYFFPAAGLWPILLSVIPFGVRLFIDRPLFHNGLIDGLLAVFLVTALIGYWATYDPTAAWIKLDLLIAGILLYYAISTQPESNLGVLAGFWFVFGVAVSVYFLLTNDFEASPAKFLLINRIGLNWMSIRPLVSWPAIQPTDTDAGIAIITSVYGLYFLIPNEETRQNKLITVFVLLGFAIVLAAVVMATSRGALVALAAAIGVLLIWLAIRRTGSRKEIIYRFFPAGVLLLFGLVALLLILPVRLFGAGFFIGQGFILSRSELIRDSISLMRDFPFLGGGLESFPGLFSQYVLVIPYYFLLNSHNLFVDVSIEQGMIGGLSFLLMYLIGLWKTASIPGRAHSNRMQMFCTCAFTSIFIAMLHGLVDDYLYSGWWTTLAFFPVGMSMLAARTEPSSEPISGQSVLFVRSSARQTGWSPQIYARASMLVVIALIVAGIGLNWNKIAAQWFANLGAVQMAKVELKGYPADKWDEGQHMGELQSAKLLFERSLAYDTRNRIANHRLGLIKMSERDFLSASNYLAKAILQEPSNRGVIKNLGYSYAWLGEMDKAYSYIQKIPEAKSEMGVYVWWWYVQGRHDLSTNASLIVSDIEHTINQSQ